MLLRFTFSNFRSFRAAQEFSMIAGSFKDHRDALANVAAIPEPILLSAALYGANASGKSNVLLALRFMASIVQFSHSTWLPDRKIPRQPFAADQERTVPSEFTVDFLTGGIRYQYGFAVSDTEVVEERLYAYPKGKRQTWFTRHQGKSMTFSEKLQGENRTIEALVRPNSLFLSAAAQNNHPALLPIYRWFSQSLSFVFGERTQWKQGTVEQCANAEYRDAIIRMLGFADLGITDLQVSESAISERAKKFALDFRTLFKSEIGVAPPFEINEGIKRIRLLHRLGDSVVPFDPNQESDGTIAYLTLLAPILSAFRNGGVVCIDELDASLHPLLAMRLIQLFNDPALNPHSAQLIFNTHDTNLLSGGLLRRDQIWFVEKKPDGASQIYPLSDFKPRKEENLANGYLQGRYGAIPFLNADCLAADRDVEQKKT